jgi:16S rRNA (guanine1207-N2)-methyltransferase
MSHYFSEKQDSRLEINKIDIKLKGMTFELLSASGIFSKDELDIGSKLLIEHAIIENSWKVHDFGCGNGVVGISIKKIYPQTKVLMSDVNERAVMIAKKNIALHKLNDIDAVKSDIFSKITENFNTILLNPPQTAGRQVCYEMITQSFDHLEKGGLLQVVARHTKGGEMLSIKMEEVFGNMMETSRDHGFRIYVSQKI